MITGWAVLGKGMLNLLSEQSNLLGEQMPISTQLTCLYTSLSTIVVCLCVFQIKTDQHDSNMHAHQLLVKI